MEDGAGDDEGIGDADEGVGDDVAVVSDAVHDRLEREVFHEGLQKIKRQFRQVESMLRNQDSLSESSITFLSKKIDDLSARVEKLITTTKVSHETIQAEYANLRTILETQGVRMTCFSMDTTIGTVADLWSEYESGWKGKPPLSESRFPNLITTASIGRPMTFYEEEETRTYKFFTSRKVIIDCILAKPSAEQLAEVVRLEDMRKSLRPPNLKELAKALRGCSARKRKRTTGIEDGPIVDDVDDEVNPDVTDA
jgi:ribosomal protein L17